MENKPKKKEGRLARIWRETGKAGYRRKYSNYLTYDEDENITLSYGVLFIFAGYKLTLTNFITYTLGMLAFLGVGIWALLKFVF